MTQRDFQLSIRSQILLRIDCCFHQQKIGGLHILLSSLIGKSIDCQRGIRSGFTHIRRIRYHRHRRSFRIPKYLLTVGRTPGTSGTNHLLMIVISSILAVPDHQSETFQISRIVPCTRQGFIYFCNDTDYMVFGETTR